MIEGPLGPVSTFALEAERMLKVCTPCEASCGVGEVVMTWAVTRSETSVPSLMARNSISSTGSSQTGSAAGRPSPALSAPVSSSTSAASAATISSSTSRSYHSPQVPSAWESPRTRIWCGVSPCHVAATMVAGPSSTRTVPIWSTSRSGASASGTSTIRVSPSVTVGSACAGEVDTTAAPTGTAAAAARRPRRLSDGRGRLSVAGGRDRCDMVNSSVGEKVRDGCRDRGAPRCR